MPGLLLLALLELATQSADPMRGTLERDTKVGEVSKANPSPLKAVLWEVWEKLLLKAPSLLPQI